jgi:thiol-disulfide isomerase/thioredoxin
MYQGDDGALQKAVALVLQNREDFVAILFYASWCPFSKIFRTDFQKLSSFFPTIAHFSFEESNIKPRCVFLKEMNTAVRFNYFWYATQTLISELQSIVKVWSSCIPNDFPSELYSACALSWISGHEFPCHVL